MFEMVLNKWFYIEYVLKVVDENDYLERTAFAALISFITFHFIQTLKVKHNLFMV